VLRCVKDELRSYLECGILCFGFARAVCVTCHTGFVVAARLSRARQRWEPLAFLSAARPATVATWPRRPPTDWAELVQVHFDRDIFQASPDELAAIDIDSI